MRLGCRTSTWWWRDSYGLCSGRAVSLVGEVLGGQVWRSTPRALKCGVQWERAARRSCQRLELRVHVPFRGRAAWAFSGVRVKTAVL